jgi:uncharacterized coiled-coil protein SlyX
VAPVQRADELEGRIVDLELRFMQQEKDLLELNGVIVDQQRAIDRLLGEVKVLREQLLAGSDGPPKDERPPHY